MAAPRTATVVRLDLAPAATEQPRTPAAGQPQLATAHPPRPLIGLLVLTLISLLEGWASLRLLFHQIRAIWWASAPADPAGQRPLRPTLSPLASPAMLRNGAQL